MRKSFEPIWNQTQKISGQIYLDVRFVKRATSMLVTDVGDEIYWRQL